MRLTLLIAGLAAVVIALLVAAGNLRQLGPASIVARISEPTTVAPQPVVPNDAEKQVPNPEVVNQRAPGTIHCRVIDFSGGVLADTPIQLIGNSSPVKTGSSSGESTSREVRTDSNGICLLSDLQFGRYNLSVADESKFGVETVSLSTRQPTVHIVIVAREGELLGGRVVDKDGMPVANARLVPVSNDDEIIGAANLESLAQLSANDGSFEFRLSARRWVLRVESAAIGRILTEALDVGRTDHLIVLTSSSTVGGSLKSDLLGEPPSNVTVQLIPLSSEVLGETETTTNDQGEFQFQNVLSGDFKLRVRSKQWVLMHGDALVSLLPAESKLDLELVVTPSTYLAGSTLNERTRLPIVDVNVNVRLRNDTVSLGASGKSDPEGRFRIDGLLPGTYMVSPSSGSNLKPEISTEVTVPGEGVDGLELLLADSCAIRGVVLDKSDMPVAGANVDARTGWFSTRATADANGVFQLEGFKAGDRVTVIASTLTAISSPVEFEATDSDSSDAKIILDTTIDGVIAGQVIASGGDGVKAFVRCESEGKGLDPVYIMSIRSMATDGNGQFAFVVPTPSRFVISTSPFNAERNIGSSDKKTIVELASGMSRTDLVLTVETGLTIEGIVQTQDRTPVPGAMIMTRQRQGDGLRGGTTSSKYDGSFQLINLSVGVFELVVTHPLYATRLVPDVHSGSEKITVVLERKSSISGIVLDMETRAPVADFEIGLRYGVSGNIGNVSSFQSVSSINGTFEIRKIDQESLSTFLEVRAEGYRPEIVDVTALSGDADVEVLLSSGDAKVNGTVTDSAGNPIANAVLRVDKYGGPPDAVSDASGTFAIENVASGATQLIAEHAEFALLVLPLVGNYATSAEPIRVVMKRPGTVVGVVTKDGRPVEGIEVYAAVRTDISVTDENGAFVLADLPPGPSEVVAIVAPASEEDGTPETTSRPVEIPEGGEVNVRIEL